jgi:hypothetical protein
MRKKVGFFVVAVFSLVLFCSPFAVSSWSPSKQGKQNKQVLSPMQQRALVRQMVNRLLHQGFFQNADLPHKVVLAKADIKTVDVGGSAKFFTDMILDILLDSPRVVVQNQDLLTDLSLKYRLVSYDDDWQCRKDGIMLGADYVVVSAIESSFETDPNGKARKRFNGRIAIRDIRSDEIVVQENVTIEKHKRSKRYK